MTDVDLKKLAACFLLPESFPALLRHLRCPCAVHGKQQDMHFKLLTVWMERARQPKSWKEKEWFISSADPAEGSTSSAALVCELDMLFLAFSVIDSNGDQTISSAERWGRGPREKSWKTW